jgi:hypothetical protein
MKLHTTHKGLKESHGCITTESAAEEVMLSSPRLSSQRSLNTLLGLHEILVQSYYTSVNLMITKSAKFKHGSWFARITRTIILHFCKFDFNFIAIRSLLWEPKKYRASIAISLLILIYFKTSSVYRLNEVRVHDNFFLRSDSQIFFSKFSSFLTLL